MGRSPIRSDHAGNGPRTMILRKFASHRITGEGVQTLPCLGLKDVDAHGSTLLRATSGRAARSGSATARPSPLACPFSKPHLRQEPWWFLPNERLESPRLPEWMKS